MQLPHAVVLPSPGDSEKPDPLEELAKSIAKGADNPPLNLPNLDLVPNTKPVQKQPLYDPMFNAESQPGFKTHERKTKQVGKFSIWPAVRHWMWKLRPWERTRRSFTGLSGNNGTASAI